MYNRVLIGVHVFLAIFIPFILFNAHLNGVVIGYFKCSSFLKSGFWRSGFWLAVNSFINHELKRKVIPVMSFLCVMPCGGGVDFTILLELEKLQKIHRIRTIE